MPTKQMDLKSFRQAVRSAIADYMRSEGCSCCRDQEAHDAAVERLGALLRVPRYQDGSGRNFYRFRTKD